MTDTTTPGALALTDPSLVGEARRLGVRLGQLAGLGAEVCSRIALVATELAPNLVKHAQGGEILVRVFSEGGRTGVEITSVDRGPGMERPEDCFRDGYSTAGSPGTGLGAVRRLSDFNEVYSLPGAGTVIVARVSVPGGSLATAETGLLHAAALHETVCGDAIVVAADGRRVTVLAADGLGHGPHAAAAAGEAARVFLEDPLRPLPDLMARLHGALQKTRGAAIALVRLDAVGRELEFCGVGNMITVVARHGASKMLGSAGGIVGQMMPRHPPTMLAWQEHDTLVMHSDGLHAAGKTLAFPGLLARHPAVIAGMLYGQQKRGRDDASVLVLRLPPSP